MCFFSPHFGQIQTSPVLVHDLAICMVTEMNMINVNESGKMWGERRIVASRGSAVSWKGASLFGPPVSWDFGVDKVGQSEKGANVSGEAVSGGKGTRRGGTTDGEESQGLAEDTRKLIASEC